MLPSFLIPDCVIREDGTGPEVALGDSQGHLILLTLEITRIIEQESLDVAIHGSTNGSDWNAKPLAAFPQKFYCGLYQILVDLSVSPEVKHIRASWKVGRWGRGEPKPLFGLYLVAQDSKSEPSLSGTLAHASA